MPDQEGIELHWIFAVIRRQIWLIVGCTLLAMVVAFIVTSTISSTYEATATLLIQPAQDTRTNEYNVLVAGERLALTYSEMLKGRVVLDTVISQNKLDETADSLARKITAQPVRDTQLIRLTIKDTSPAQAAFLANAIAEAFIKHVQTIQKERYAGSLSNLEEEMGALSSQIDEIQAKIQTLNTDRIDNEAEQEQLENLLTEYRSNYQQMQQDYQTAQLALATLIDKVSVAEAAQPSSITPATTATVTLLFDQPSGTGEGSFSAETYGKMLVARPILEAAITKLGLDMDAGLLARRIKVSPVPGTQLIELDVVDSNVSQATLLADTIAEVFIEQLQASEEKPYIDRIASLQTQLDELQLRIGGTQVDIASLMSDKLKLEAEIASLENQLAGYRSDYRTLQQDYSEMQLTVANAADAVVVTEPASIPENSAQHRMLYIALATLVGAMLAIGAAFLTEYLNDVVRTPDDVSRALNLSTLGSISLIEEPDNGLVAFTQSRSPVAEAFRVLATNIRVTGLEKPLRTILVTSPNAQEGKSLVVANLATTLAQRELRVVLIDADLRLPRQHLLFGLNQGKGLTGALLEGHAGELIRRTSIEGLRILTSGDLPSNPAELVASARMRKLLDEIAQDADLVLIDCPPVLPVADTTILASIVDGILLVVRADHTRRQEIGDSVENLRKVGGHLLGVVLNGVPGQTEHYYKYYGEEKSSDKSGLGRWKQSLRNMVRYFGVNGSRRKASWNANPEVNRGKKKPTSVAQFFKKRG
jgi:non-specific protein-tyrosine kinase